jgi:selenocysteine-specific elongation factor
MTSSTTDRLAEPPLHVVATAGHVDHGKSSLILRLTGTDPDRLAEEKRRGLTIDLGFAWCTLPSGREIGFVDVPGHERFIRNMLAGVGPVRLVLFVVAADEGWKQQSEEHLAIIDVLAAEAGVVALTKCDLVETAALEAVEAAVRDRLRGSALERAPIVACSSVTGEGIDELREALDAMVAAAPLPPEDERPRQFVDRIFTIKGAGTVVTGTLTGGRLKVGGEVELYPTGARARIRGLQTHKRPLSVARPVSRVAANLAGLEKEMLARGDVLGLPGEWRPTRAFDARIRPVRGIDRAVTARGAFKLYAGSAERDARIRLYGTARLEAGGTAFARIRLSRPLVLDFGDRFVLREAGRRETVAGGVVLDTEPPPRAGPDVELRLQARERAKRGELPGLLIRERGAIRASHVALLTGRSPSTVAGASRVGVFWADSELLDAVGAAVRNALAAFHQKHPLQEGADLAFARAAATDAIERSGAPSDARLVDALLDHLVAQEEIARMGAVVRIASHRVTLAGHEPEVESLIQAVAAAEPAPPTVAELLASGTDPEVLDAAVRSGALVRVSPELVMTPAFVAKAESIARAAKEGITVSAFREALGTSRKFALPILEHFDRSGVTRRDGDLRVPRRREA